MRKFVITSPKFTGEIHVLYALPDGTPPKLQFIDFMKADLSEDQMQSFKEKLPVWFTDDFMAAFGNSKLTVTEEGYRVSFDMWWTRYNKKINRLRSEKIWNKLTEAEQVNAFVKMPMYDRHLKLEHWKTKADPETYLKNRYWDNEWK